MSISTKTIGTGVMFALLLAANAPAHAQTAPGPYPAMAPIEQYRSTGQAEEIALARSAAPASISAKAEILTLGAHGYETAVKGENGFVCEVERSWAKGFADPEFWNPKVRAPNCYNPAAARSVLPTYLKRTEWVLAGVSKDEMAARTKRALDANGIATPEIGAMVFMMSKDQYLTDQGPPNWYPHLMFYIPHMAPSAWGADLAGAPLVSNVDDLIPVTTFMVPVRKWSDGTRGP